MFKLLDLFFLEGKLEHCKAKQIYDVNLAITIHGDIRLEWKIK